MKTGLFGLAILLGLPVSSICTDVASAGDFGNAQRTFVPNSLIQRRYDTEPPVGQTNWGGSTGSSGASNGSASASSNYSSSSSGSAGGDGFVSAAAALNALNGAKSPSNLSFAYAKSKITLQKLVAKGKWDDAEKLGLKLIKLNPRDQEVRDKLTQVMVAEARSAYSKGDIDTAARKAREALVTEPSNQPAKVVLTQVFTKKGLNFQNAKDHLKLADGLAAQSKFVEASAEYHLALNIKPSAAAHVGLGNILVGERHPEDAAKEYATAIQTDPKSSIAFRQLGSLRLSVNDLIGANHDLSQAVTLNPNDHQAASELIELWQHQVSNNLNAVNGHLGLARAYLLTGSLEAAQTEYREVAKLDPNNAQLPAARVAFKAAMAKRESQKCLDIAKTLNGQGAFRDAHDKLIESMNYAAPTAEVLMLNGQVCEKLGLYDEAHQAYMAILKDDPSNITAAQHLKALPQTAPANSPAKSSTFPPVAPTRSPPSAQTSSAPATDSLTAGSAFDPNTGQNALVPDSALHAKLPSQVDDPLSAVPSETPSPAVPSPAAGSPTAAPQPTHPSTPNSTSTSTPAAVPAGIVAPASGPASDSLSGSAPAVVPGDPTASPTSIQVAPTGTPILPAPEGADTVGHTSKLSNLFNSIKGMSASQQQPQAQGVMPGYYVPAGFPGQSLPAYSPYGGAQAMNPYGQGSYMMPGMVGAGAYGQGGYIMPAQIPANYAGSAGASQSPSLLGLLAKPITNKLGMQPLGTSDQPPAATMVAMPQIVQGPNGTFYMVPTAVPATYAGNQSQGNPAFNDIANSRAGKRFHLAQVVQDGSGVGSFLSSVKIPIANHSHTQVSGAMVPTTSPSGQATNQVMPAGDNFGQSVSLQSISQPVVPSMQVKDWNTGTAEAESADTNQMDTTGDDGTATSADSETGDTPKSTAPTEIALKPSVGTLSLGSSWAHTITLEIAEVKPTLTGAKVKVILKNNSGKTVSIAEHQKIAFQTEEKPEQLLDIQFDTHTVAAGASASGTVKLPVHQLDPDSDLYLPKFIEQGKKHADLHATADL